MLSYFISNLYVSNNPSTKATSIVSSLEHFFLFLWWNPDHSTLFGYKQQGFLTKLQDDPWILIWFPCYPRTDVYQDATYLFLCWVEHGTKLGNVLCWDFILLLVIGFWLTRPEPDSIIAGVPVRSRVRRWRNVCWSGIVDCWCKEMDTCFSWLS